MDNIAICCLARDGWPAMTQLELTRLSLGELCDRLKAHADHLNDKKNGIDPVVALRYLATLPSSAHNSHSAEALLQVTRSMDAGVGPAEMLQAASLAAQIARSLNNRLLLARARFKEGIALTKLGRFAEATGAQAETWSLARELNNKEIELQAAWGFSTVFVAMGQWDAAIRCCERMRILAQETGKTDYEFTARNNLADCALQLRDTARAMPTLLKLAEDAPHAGIESHTHAHLHNNLTRLWLLVGDVARANFHVKQAGQWAAVWGAPIVVHCVEALQGLVDVRLGFIDRGLLAVDRALDFAQTSNRTEVPDCLGICVDAYEAAGRFDEALVYLQKLVEWKKTSVDAEALRQFYDLTEAGRPQTGTAAFDHASVAKVQSLRAGSSNLVERLLEIAVNADIACGNDLYRPFRISGLARHLALRMGWGEKRVESLVLAARLCNIGMIASPARILFKPDRLSEYESGIVRGHAEYGAELLRKSKLQVLDMAVVVARQHHEHYDGSGYPAGLKGEAIAEEARLIAVCDAFDAMTHKRPWRDIPMSTDAALSELNQAASSRLDPRYVRAFVEFFENELAPRQDLDGFLAEGADEHEYVRVRSRIDGFIADAR